MVGDPAVPNQLKWKWLDPFLSTLRTIRLSGGKAAKCLMDLY